jgi:hypothetical protein
MAWHRPKFNRAGFEPIRGYARHLRPAIVQSFSHAVGKIVRTARLKTGAGQSQKYGTFFGAPSFSPYRSWAIGGA